MNEQEKYDWMVYVSCMTFNHASYIVDAMNGFTMQETNFPFVCGIVDDASSDSEQEVIKQYLNDHFDLEDKKVARHEETDDYVLTFARHKTNSNCHFAVLALKYNHYGTKQLKARKLEYVSEWRDKAKYIAICEGDDYWIDPLKLQKQVDFMDKHPRHSLCFCSHKNLYPSGEIIIESRYDEDIIECPMEDIILGGGGFMATNSMLYRNSSFVSYTTWTKNSPVGDLPMMLTLAHRGKVGYIADVMCVYRKSAMGSWTQRMSTDFNKRRSHYRAILKMFDEYDEYTNYRYHGIIVRKKRFNMISHYKDVIQTFQLKLKKMFVKTK